MDDVDDDDDDEDDDDDDDDDISRPLSLRFLSHLACNPPTWVIPIHTVRKGSTRCWI